MIYNVLVVEDQEEISSIVSKYLHSEGYNSFVVCDGLSALEFFNKHECHLVILDIMMPGINGFDVLKEIRAVSDIPVIILTAKQDEIDRLKGFDIGADDYVIKPFSARELMRRIKALIKRTYNEAAEIVYTAKDVTLHTKSMKLYKGKKEVGLTSVEFNLLFTFFRNIGQVMSREQLINQSFGNDYEGFDRNIDSYIRRIRHKIEDEPQKPKILITKYGAGYIFGGKE